MLILRELFGNLGEVPGMPKLDKMYIGLTESARVAAGKALEAAKEYYSEHKWHQLAEDIALYTELSGTRAFVHFSFFHRQLSRIVKYTRRGIRILHLPCWWHVWIGLEHVKGLPQ